MAGSSLYETWTASNQICASIVCDAGSDLYALTVGRDGCHDRVDWTFASYLDAYMTMERFGSDWRKVR